MMLSSNLLSQYASLKHGFFTRKGGVSQGAYASLNCGRASGDLEEHVEKNREQVAAALGVKSENLLTARQEHGVKILTARELRDSAPKSQSAAADGIITNETGFALGILTADCAPVLLADAEEGIVGAVHAGWRGAKKGVLEEALLKMEAMGAKRRSIIAAIGPCISQDSYEVSGDFRASFLEQDGWSAEFFKEGKKSHAFFDLEGYIAARLARAGISRSDRVGGCSFRDSEHFFSHRRGEASGEPCRGRQISAIVLCERSC